LAIERQLQKVKDAEMLKRWRQRHSHSSSSSTAAAAAAAATASLTDRKAFLPPMGLGRLREGGGFFLLFLAQQSSCFSYKIPDRDRRLVRQEALLASESQVSGVRYSALVDSLSAELERLSFKKILFIC